MIRVTLPYHLRTLAQVGPEVTLEVAGPVTQRSVLDALEARYPMLRGTIRDHVTQQRRPMLRFFACEEDLSLDPPDTPLPDAVASGAEPFWVVGAIAAWQGSLAAAMPAGPEQRDDLMRHLAIAQFPTYTFMCEQKGGRPCVNSSALVWLC